MKAMRVRLGTFLLFATFLAGCSSMNGPDKNSGLFRIKLQWISGALKASELRGNVISLIDSHGKEIYNIRDRSTFTYTIDVPAGEYTLITTCAPAAFRYENDQTRYHYQLKEFKLNAESGNYVRLIPSWHGSWCIATPTVSAH